MTYWTQEKHNEALKLWKAGISTRSIAKQMGITGGMVSGYISRNRNSFKQRHNHNAVNPRYCKEEEIAKAARLYNSGVSPYDIAKKMKMSRATFYKMKKNSPSRFIGLVKSTSQKLKNPFRATQGAIARRGEGLHLKNGKGYLHWSGEILTKEPAFYWRGTARQAQNMMAKSEHELTVVLETNA